MGVVITSASQAILKGVDVSKLWDPIFLLSQLTSSKAPAGLDAPLIASGATRALVAVISLFGVTVATLSVNIAANVVSPANDFANLAPRHISFKTGGLITGILGIVMMPWKLLSSAEAYIFNWLVGYSALLGPIAGIMVVDYWLIRRTELDVPDLYRPTGRYAGTNPVALVALTLGVLPNLPGFLKSAKLISGPESFWDQLYVYAWFTGFLLAGLIYFLGMRSKREARALPANAAWIGRSRYTFSPP
jgi:NCS1 family nucleobase:cation symporter-1